MIGKRVRVKIKDNGQDIYIFGTLKEMTIEYIILDILGSMRLFKMKDIVTLMPNE